MPTAKPFGSVTRIHRELQGKNKEFSAAKRTNRKRIFRVLGFAAAAMLGCALISSQVVAQSPPPASFQSASLLQFSDSRYGAYSLATGDFNGDGKPDLIIIGEGSTCCPTTADIFLGNGDGTFSLSQAISPLNGNIATNPHVVAVGDFNGDGHLDFAVAMQGGSLGSLDVYLGDGTGHFTFSANYSYGSRNGGAGSIAVADVNGDGKLDLVVGNGFEDGTITVMLGNGDGTFSPQTPFVCCQNNPSWDVMDVAVADFNNDGHPDIAVADQAGGIDILLNKGDGTFQVPVFYSEPGGGAFYDAESGIAAADLNHDGKQDVVLAWNGGFWVYLGNGDGTFSTPVNYGTPCSAYGCFGESVALADINGDNKLDVILADLLGSTVWAFLGNGDGTFQPATGYATDFFPQSVAIADFNGDGKPDFAVGNGEDDQVTIALGKGDGTFQAGADYDPINPYASSGEVAADFNNDGYLDVATWGSDGHHDFIRVMLNNSHGVLGTPIITTVFGCCTQSIADIKAGDVNGDGKVDLVGVISETNPQIVVYLGNGNGTFEAPVFYFTGSSQTPYGVVLADLRNNGNLDALVSNDDGSLSVLLNNGDGTFGTATVIPSVSGNYGGMIVSGDFNGDGKIDLAIRDSKDSSINILLGNGDGSFQSPMMVPVATGPEGIAVGDFNQDGKLDLATAGYGIGQTLFGSGGLAVMLGNGDGTFSPPTYYSFYPGYSEGNPDPNLPVVADVNLDGIPDLLVTFAISTHVGPPGTCCYPTNNIGIAVMLGKGDGTFEFENPLGEPGIAGGPFLVGTGSSDLVAGDFNGDGAPDAAVLNNSSAANSYNSYVTMLLNTTTGSGVCTTTTLRSSANPAAYGQAVMLTATVVACEGSPPTGPVTFFDGGIQIGTAPLAGGQATLTISTLGVGSHSITAIFGGNGSFKPSASAPLTEVVSSAAQAAAPTFSKGTGTYTGTQSITLSTTAGTVICYNTTGAAMTVGSGCTGGTQYTGTAVAVSSSETLYAVAGGPGYTQSSVNSATYTINFYFTLTLTELGTGTGTVTDNQSPQQINCKEANGIVTGTCSGTYLSGTAVTLTAAATSPSTFAGWGGACASSGTSTTCSLTMNSAQNVTADFVAPPIVVPLTLTPGTNVTGTATFCPNGSSPCTDPNGHEFSILIPVVNSGFPTLYVTATEVDPNGLCPAGGNGQSSDFDCRFVSFFNYGIDPATGDTVVPLCYPYSNGNCIHYNLSLTGAPGGGEPPQSSYSGGVYWRIAFNNDTFTPPGPYWTGSTPRLLDDPDVDEFTPPLPWGTNCSTPMTGINGSPTSPAIYCQFDADITTFFNASEAVDSTIGGKTNQANDVVVAFLPTSTGSDPVQTPPSKSAPAITGSCVNGCVPIGTVSNNATITFTEGTGGTFAVTETGFPTPTLTESGTLPTGLTFNATTGLVSGTPADGTAASYSITFTATNSVSSNATLNYTLTVNPAGALTITASSPSMTYGGTVPAITPSYSGFVNGDTAASLTRQPTCSITGSPTKVGTYTTTCSGAADANYSAINYVSGTLTVNPAALTITASSSTMAYGGTVPTITPSYSGFVNGDTAASLTTQPTCTTTATSKSPAGTYPSSCSGAVDANYKITYVNGTVTVTLSALEISPTSVNFGTLYLGEPAVQFVTLTNKGTTPITISSVKVTAPGNALGEYGDITFCSPLISAMPGTLPAGKSCKIAVGLLAFMKIFSPTASTATLTITDSAAGSPQSVPLTAQVIDPQATLSAYFLNFGKQTEHTTSTKTVKLTNTGLTPLSLTSIAISGSFTLSSGTTCASGMMNPSASCILNVTFTPESKGPFIGKVTITDNAFFSPQVITLAGTGD